MPKKQCQYEFTVEVGGKTYQCERVVSGTRVLTQRVTVSGCGAENDQAHYGRRDHPVASMPGVAKLIARRLIEKADKG